MLHVQLYIQCTLYTGHTLNPNKEFYDCIEYTVYYSYGDGGGREGGDMCYFFKESSLCRDIAGGGGVKSGL